MSFEVLCITVNEGSNLTAASDMLAAFMSLDDCATTHEAWTSPALSSEPMSTWAGARSIGGWIDLDLAAVLAVFSEPIGYLT